MPRSPNFRNYKEGGKKWGNTKWRKKHLKEMRGDLRKEANKINWKMKMVELKRQGIEQEIVIMRKELVKGAQFLENMSQELGLYFHSYNKGENEVFVVSKVPLPNYRADLDEMHGSMQREIQISMVTECRVESILASAREVCVQESMPSGSSRIYHSPVHSSEIPGGYGDKLLSSLDLCHQQWQLQATPAAAEMQRFRERLPAYKMKDQLLRAVANNQLSLSFQDHFDFTRKLF